MAAKRIRVNRDIRASKVRVIDAEGGQLGILDLGVAQAKAAGAASRVVAAAVDPPLLVVDVLSSLQTKLDCIEPTSPCYKSMEMAVRMCTSLME